MTTTYVPCIGAHYINAGYLGGFDGAHPAMLLYDGTKPDSRIVRLGYAALSGKAPPVGFAGGHAISPQPNLHRRLWPRGRGALGAPSHPPPPRVLPVRGSGQI